MSRHGRKKNSVLLEPPSVTRQIARTLERYPDGGQILKELIQNADDAEATEVKFILDCNHYPTKNLIDDKLSQFQGPALYAWNNSIFQDEDWDHFGKMENSSKEKDALKVGRFGVGFLSVFHITDLPIVISTDTVAILDPHEKYTGTHKRGWSNDLETFLSYRGHAACFANLGSCSIPSDASDYPHTIFRFPLRLPGADSEITRNPYPVERVREFLYESFFKEAPIILLFLKYVEEISLYDGDKLLYKVSIHPSCKGIIRSERKALIEIAQSPLYSSLRLYSMTSCVENMSQGDRIPTQYHWLILNMIGSTCGKINELSGKLQILPWVGVAVPLPNMLSLSDVCIPNLDIDQVSHALIKIERLIRLKSISLSWHSEVQGHREGRAFCFLPLPIQTHLPVNIHGYFAVSDNRRTIEWPASDNKSDKALWNRELLLKQVAPLYSILIGCRSQLIRYHDTSLPTNEGTLTDPYAAWPLYSDVKHKEIWSEIVKPTMAGCIDGKIFWSATDQWVSPREAIFIPEVMTTFPLPEIAMRILVQARMPIVKLPHEIWETIRECGLYRMLSNFIAPDHVRRAFTTSCTAFHSYDEFEPLLECLLYDINKHNYTELFNLSIIPLATKGTFTRESIRKASRWQSDCDDDTIYFIEKGTHRITEIVPGTENRIVNISTARSSSIYSKLHSLASWEISQIRLLNPKAFCCQLLPGSIRTWSNAGHNEIAEWNIKSHSTPSLEWIKKLWNWLRMNPAMLDAVGGIQLLPKELLKESTVVCRLLPFPKLGDKYYFKVQSDEAFALLLEKLGAQVIERNPFVATHDSISRFVIDADMPNLVEYLRNKTSIIGNVLSHSDIETLRLSIAHYYSRRYIDNKTKQLLCDLPIYQAGIGAVWCCSLTSARQNNFLLPPLSMSFDLQLSYPGSILNNEDKFVHTLMSNTLGYPVSNDEQMYTALLTHAFSLQSQYYSWDDGDKLIAWVLQQCRSLSNTLVNLLSKRAFIRTSANCQRLKKPCELFNPNDDQFQQLFDANSDEVFPNIVYSENGALPKLLTAGVVSWRDLQNDVHRFHSFIHDRATTVSTLPETLAFKRSCSIMEIVCSMPRHKLVMKHLETVKFLQMQEIPEDFPSFLPWFEKQKNSKFEAPVNLCYNFADITSLVGSVVPILSSSYKHKVSFQFPDHVKEVFRHLSIEDVLKQLNVLVQKTPQCLPSRDALVQCVSNMVDKIYKYLNNSCHLLESRPLPSNWIWWLKGKNYSFMPSDSFVIDSPFNLSPYVFSIRSDERFLKCTALLRNSGIKSEPELSDLDNILQKVANSYGQAQLSDKEVKMSLSIINRLHEMKYANLKSVLLLTSDKKLRPASECTYDDREWVRNKVGTEFKALSLLHEKISPKIAKDFKVEPLSKKVVAPTKRKMQYLRKGQKESLTRRISGIVNDYCGNIDVFKELIQNADDAEATTIKFVMDWRYHGKVSLFEENMKHWQGPALIAYNDATFSDDDFDNICEIAAETKMSDPLKTGRFGVGFCSCYSLTDVPSFLSREYLTIFDPHATYLKEWVSSSEPGLQINMVEERKGVSVYEDQFAPYDNFFGCNVSRDDFRGFNGTLFRFPLRLVGSKQYSAISNEDRFNYQIMSKKFKELKAEAQKLLIFLKHVCSLEVFELSEGAKSPRDMRLIFKVSKVSSPPLSRFEMIENHKDDPSKQDPVLTSCTVSVKVPSEGIDIQSKYILASAIETFQEEYQSTKLPLCELAVEVNENGVPVPLTNGQLFCFLPLPISQSLPFHVNGYFNVGKDRRGLKVAEDSTDFQWNRNLIKCVLPRAFECLLVELTAMMDLNNMDNRSKSKQEALRSYYSLFPPNPTGWVSECFCSSVKEYFPATTKALLWSEVNGGKWVGLTETCFYKTSFRVCSEIENDAIELLLSKEYCLVQCPKQWYDLFESFVKENDNLWKYESFFINMFLPNISYLPKDSRNKHLLFLLKKIYEERHSSVKNFEWAVNKLKESQCIPLAESGDLAHPCELIDTRCQHIVKLYCVSDDRFPDEEFRKDQSITEALVSLGMITKELPVDELAERANTVAHLAMDSYSDAVTRMNHILEYLVYIERKEHNYTYYSLNTAKRQARIDALSSVKFLKAEEKPQHVAVPWIEVKDDEFFSPVELYPSKCTHLLFIQKPILFTLDPDTDSHEAKFENVEIYLGINKKQPDFDDVLENLINLIHYLQTVNDEQMDNDNDDTITFLDDAFDAIYSYLNKHCSEDDNENNIMSKLGNLQCIWQSGQLHYPHQLLGHWNNVSFYPYLCSLSVKNKNHMNLWSTIGVKGEADFEFLNSVLEAIQNDFESQPLISELLKFVQAIAQTMFDVFQCDVDKAEQIEVYLPNSEGVLCLSSRLSCDSSLKDVEWISRLDVYQDFLERGDDFVNEIIPKVVACRLGAYPILDAILKDNEDRDFLNGIPFDQYEDLVDRLNGILKKYPADESIFKEFIQNADDAEAEEIVFILDHRTNYPEKGLLTHNSRWKDLQSTPALCIFNDRPFEEKDIKDICKLGRGGKGETADTIGRFGIGFNVAYHVTDCPSFVSFDETGLPENFCVFDPLMKYCTTGQSLLRGRRWIGEVLRQFPDQTKPYLKEDFTKFQSIVPSCFSNTTDGFTMFRLPVVHYSGLNQPTLKEAKIHRLSQLSSLAEKLKDQSENMLLFLKNLTSISFFEITSSDNIIHRFTSSKKSNHLDCDNTEIELHFSNKSNNSCSKWLVNTNNAGLNLKKDFGRMVTAGSERGLKPEGSTAICLEYNYCNTGYLFYFLPLKIPSCLPVHLNAHFLVDDSRNHLDKLPDLEEWNQRVAKYVIVPSYIRLILKARDEVDGSEESVKWYYSLFPRGVHNLVKSEASAMNIEVLFYETLVAGNHAVLIDHRNLSEGEVKWLNIKEGKVGLFCLTFTKSNPYVQMNDKVKQCLLSIGMPITDTPESVFENLCNSSPNDYEKSRVGLVTPVKVINFLKNTDSLEEDVIKSNCAELLKFCLQSFKGSSAKSYLQGAPILLTLENTLDKSGSLFTSTFATLLPNCREHFVNKRLESSQVGQKLKQLQVIVSLPVHFISQQIELKNCDAPVILSSEQRSTVRLLWSYLVYPLNFFDHQGDVICDHFNCKPIIPASNGKFYPPLLGKCVYKAASGNEIIVTAMKKLGYPTATYSMVGQSGVPNCASSALSSSSNSSDIVRCMELIEPNYNVSFTSHEVSQLISVLCLHSEIPQSVSEMLMRLPLFETVDGHYHCLSEAKKFYIMPSDIPRAGLEKIQEATNQLILKVTGVQTEGFYKHLMSLSQYKSSKPSAPQFYIQLILPHFDCLNEDELFKHLAVLQNWLVLSLTDMPQEDKEELVYLMKSTPFVIKNGRRYLPSQLYDPTVEFHAKFNESKLPPENWSQKFLSLLKKLGLQQSVDTNVWLNKAKKVAEEGKEYKHSTPPPALVTKSDGLLSALEKIIEHHCPANGNEARDSVKFFEFLKKLSAIPFIYKSTQCEILGYLNVLVDNDGRRQRTSNFVLFHSALLIEHEKLAFLSRTILPKSCNFIKKHRLVSDALSIQSVSVKAVVKNLIELSRCLCSADVQVLLLNQEKVCAIQKLREVFVKHYEFLENHCNDKSASCLKDLVEERCILLSDDNSSFHLVRPGQVVMRLPQDVKLEPFCYQVPMTLQKYSNILKAIGVREDLEYLQCLDILQDLHQEMGKESLALDEAYKTVCNNVYSLLIKLLRKDPHVSIPKKRKVFLPSEKYELLEPNTLMCNDVPWIQDKLLKTGNSDYKFLLPPEADEKGQKVPPPCLGVKLLSEIASEKLHKDVFDQLNKCTHQEHFENGKRLQNCEVINLLRATLSSREFRIGFGRLYWDEHESDPRTDRNFCKRLKNITKLSIQCVETIKTVVELKGREVQKTADKTHLCYLKEKDDNLVLYVKHDIESEEKFCQQLAVVLNTYLKRQCSKNVLSIQAMFQCAPNEIESVLDKLKVMPFNPENTQIASDELAVGASVNLTNFIHDELEKVILCSFKKGEKVIYHSVLDDGSSSHKIAVVTEDLTLTEAISCPAQKVRLCIDINKHGHSENRAVSILRVYKILTKSQSCTLTSNGASRFATPLSVASLPLDEQQLHQWIDEIFSDNLITLTSNFSELSKRIIVHMHYIFSRRTDSREIFLTAAKRLLRIVADLADGVAIVNQIKSLVKMLEKSAVKDDDVFGDTSVPIYHVSSIQHTNSVEDDDMFSATPTVNSSGIPTTPTVNSSGISATPTVNSSIISTTPTTSQNTGRSFGSQPQSSTSQSQQAPKRSRFGHLINQAPSTSTYRLPSAMRSQSVNFPTTTPSATTADIRPPPNRSDKLKAKIWLQQAKADYMAACELCRGFVTTGNDALTAEPVSPSVSEEETIQDYPQGGDNVIEEEQSYNGNIEMSETHDPLGIPAEEVKDKVKEEEQSDDSSSVMCSNGFAITGKDTAEAVSPNTLSEEETIQDYPQRGDIKTEEDQSCDGNIKMPKTHDPLGIPEEEAKHEVNIEEEEQSDDSSSVEYSYEHIEMAETPPPLPPTSSDDFPDLLGVLETLPETSVEEVLVDDGTVPAITAEPSLEREVTVVPSARLDNTRCNPALVCFLCHDALEKCIKGVLYASHKGLSDRLIDCSHLMTLCHELQQGTRLHNKMTTAALLITDYANKTRYPNYHNPLCVPAMYYSQQDAQMAVTTVNEVMSFLAEEEDFEELLGDLSVFLDVFWTALTSSVTDNSRSYPDNWTEHTEDDGSFKLVLLDNEECDVEEYNSVASTFESTMRCNRILRIHRVQNKLLWNKFSDCAKRMKEFNHGRIEQKCLFHGTSFNPPEQIYQGDAGFDMRFCNFGLWGRGNYFAVNASYSDSYSYKCVGGRRQMFMAYVLTGFAYDCSPDSNLTKPPYRPADSGNGVRMRYDSVSGVTAGSKVFITYENERAYPAYLITYI